jgi:hypothetical protein
MLFLALLPAFIVVAIINFFLNYQQQQIFILPIYLISLLLFFILLAKWSLRKYDLSIPEKFAYACERIALDFEKLSIDRLLPVNPTYSINSLSVDSETISKYFKNTNKKLSESLLDFSNKIDKLIVLLEEPTENKSKFADLSKKFNALAEKVITKQEFDLSLINPIIELTKNIVKPSKIEKTRNLISSFVNYYKKSFYLKKVVYLALSFIFSFIVYEVAVNSLGINKDSAFQDAIIVLIGLIGVILATGKKS